MKERRARMEVRWVDMRFWCCPWWISTLLMKTAEWIGMRFRCWRLISTMLRVRCWTVTFGSWIIIMIWDFFCKHRYRDVPCLSLCCLLTHLSLFFPQIFALNLLPTFCTYIYIAIVADTGEEGSASRRPRNLTYAASGGLSCLPLFPFGILFLHFRFGNGNWQEWYLMNRGSCWPWLSPMILLSYIHQHQHELSLNPDLPLLFGWINLHKNKGEKFDHKVINLHIDTLHYDHLSWTNPWWKRICCLTPLLKYGNLCQTLQQGF